MSHFTKCHHIPNMCNIIHIFVQRIFIQNVIAKTSLKGLRIVAVDARILSLCFP